jgi:hypothetical protein
MSTYHYLPPFVYWGYKMKSIMLATNTCTTVCEIHFIICSREREREIEKEREGER